MELQGKKVLVFGSGKSGIGASDLLAKVGAFPVIYDGNAKILQCQQCDHTHNRCNN